MRQRSLSRVKPKTSHLAWHTHEITDPPGQRLFSTSLCCDIIWHNCDNAYSTVWTFLFNLRGKKHMTEDWITDMLSEEAPLQLPIPICVHVPLWHQALETNLSLRSHRRQPVIDFWHLKSRCSLILLSFLRTTC